MKTITKVLLPAALILLAADLYAIFALTPTEASGIIQKIFYVHVPCAFAMYLGLAIGFVFSVAYLWKRKDKFDMIAYSGVEVGFVFACCVLVSGPIWAKGAWGKFWDFDPRLTATLIVWFIYFSYLVLRNYYSSTAKGKIFCAIIATIGFIDVPIIHYSVRMWRGIHPKVISKGGGGIPDSMLHTLMFSGAVFIVIFAYIFTLKLGKEFKKAKTIGD